MLSIRTGCRKGSEKMYRKSLKIFLTGTGVAVLLRALLKVLFVDLETGFYLGGAPLASAFAAVLILSGAGLLWFGWREQDESAAFLKGNRWLECTAALLGAVLLADSVSGLLRVLAISPDAQLINQMPRLLQLLEHLLALPRRRFSLPCHRAAQRRRAFGHSGDAGVDSGALADAEYGGPLLRIPAGFHCLGPDA